MDEGKVFKDEVHGLITIPDYCIKIIDTPQFQRLRSIKQLGGAEYVYPGATHTRFAHSVGVCHLSLEVVTQLKKDCTIKLPDEQCVVLAGLCHDLGHGPLSHKFEGVIETLQPKSPEDKQDKWTHEKASVEILKSLEDKLPGDNKDKRREMRLRIRDFIMGKPEKMCRCQELEKCMNGEVCHQVIANEGLQKRWEHYKTYRYLYQIVSNSDSGIDVDKWDYLSRDCSNLGLTTDFDHKRLIKYMRVLPCRRNGYAYNTDEICFRSKAAIDIGKMFTARWNNHELACKHRVVMLIEQMFTDVLVKYFEANQILWENFPEDGKPSFLDCPRIEDITGDTNVDNYLQMNDSILDAIERSTKNIQRSVLFGTIEEGKEGITQPTKNHAKNKLADVSKILQRIKTRNLYTFIGSKEKRSKDPGEELVDVDKSKVKSALIDDIRLNNSPFQDIVNQENLVIINHRLDYGRKDKAPLDNVFFYKKNKSAPATSNLLKPEEKPLNFPEAVKSQFIYVYSISQIEDTARVEEVTEIVELSLDKYINRLIDEHTPPAGSPPSAPIPPTKKRKL